MARPTDQLAVIADMYMAGLGLEKLGSFCDHDGFDGVMLGHKDCPYHFEFTHHRGTTVGRAPTQDNLLVFYVEDIDVWERHCERMLDAGFSLVSSYNPYWDGSGCTFEDADGYRVVLQKGRWPK